MIGPRASAAEARIAAQTSNDKSLLMSQRLAVRELPHHRRSAVLGVVSNSLEIFAGRDDDETVTLSDDEFTGAQVIALSSDQAERGSWLEFIKG